MRLWHKDLIPVLPRQQLLGQWRECCLIAKNIVAKGTPNHLLVNKIMDYPMAHFSAYIDLVIREMHERGYRINRKSYINMITNLNNARKFFKDGPAGCNTIIFSGWHNERYLIQCLMNLQEKYDCGGISEEEWIKVSSIIKEVSK